MMVHIKELFRNIKYKKQNKKLHLDFQFILPSNNQAKFYKQKNFNIGETDYVVSFIISRA